MLTINECKDGVIAGQEIQASVVKDISDTEQQQNKEQFISPPITWGACRIIVTQFTNLIGEVVMDDERDSALFDDGDTDMETDRVDATSHSRESVKNGNLCVN